MAKPGDQHPAIAAILYVQLAVSAYEVVNGRTGYLGYDRKITLILASNLRRGVYGRSTTYMVVRMRKVRATEFTPLSLAYYAMPAPARHFIA